MYQTYQSRKQQNIFVIQRKRYDMGFIDAIFSSNLAIQMTVLSCILFHVSVQAEHTISSFG